MRLKLWVWTLLVVAMATMVGASPEDGGGKPRALSNPDAPSTMGASAPAPAPAPAFPSSSEGVAAAASLSSEEDNESEESEKLTDSGPLQVDACGFGLDWFPLDLPGFCVPPEEGKSLLIIPTDGNLGAWEETWAGMAPGIQNSMKRPDAGKVNQTMKFLRSLMPPEIYDSMANCVLEWWISRLVKNCLSHIAAALAEKKAAFYAALAGEEWTDRDREVSWGPLYDRYHTSWHTQMDTLVKRYRFHARAGWGGGAAPLYLLTMGQLSRRRRRRRTREDIETVTDSSDGAEGSSDGVGQKRGRPTRGKKLAKRKREQHDEDDSADDAHAKEDGQDE